MLRVLSVVSPRSFRSLALALSPTDQAGRAYAVYGGVYIVSSLLRLWMVERQRPDQWDIVGGVVCLT